MQADLEEAKALLVRAPGVFDALLRGLPEALVRSSEGEGTWTAYGVVAHLIHCDRANWMVRAKVILQHGEGETFPPFERNASSEASLGELLDEFRLLRETNLRELESLGLTSLDLERRGTHPTFGSVTLKQLLTTWAAHDLTHLHQVSRILAHQLREDVGPWSAFLGVLKCDGHSA